VERPRITTAIPQRRYQLGDYVASVLGEIESPDPPRYQYIMAVVPERESQPVVYVTCDRKRRNTEDGAYRLMLVMEGFKEDMGSSDDWGDVDAFADAAFAIVVRALNLGKVEPLPLE
jgi:hypothetical protein